MDARALSPRRQLIASLIAAGWSNTRIAKSLGISLTCVKDARRLPAVQAEIARESAHLRGAIRFEMAKAMAAEEQASFERWRELRDQDENLPVALGAVRAHLDRVLPKVGVVHEEKPVEIIITLEEQQRLEQVIREGRRPLLGFDGGQDDAEEEHER